MMEVDMNKEKCMDLLEKIVEDESIPSEYRDELEWISYEDLEDGVDLAEVLENLKEKYPAKSYPVLLEKLMKEVLK